MMEKELTDEQIENQEFIDNTVHSMLELVAGKALPWNIELIGNVRDTVISELNNFGHAVKY